MKYELHRTLKTDRRQSQSLMAYLRSLQEPCNVGLTQLYYGVHHQRLLIQSLLVELQCFLPLEHLASTRTITKI